MLCLYIAPRFIVRNKAPGTRTDCERGMRRDRVSQVARSRCRPKESDATSPQCVPCFVERIRCESSLSKSVAACSRIRRGASSRQSGVYHARTLSGDFSPRASVPRSRAASSESFLGVSATRQRDFTDRTGEFKVSVFQPRPRLVKP